MKIRPLRKHLAIPLLLGILMMAAWIFPANVQAAETFTSISTVANYIRYNLASHPLSITIHYQSEEFYNNRQNVNYIAKFDKLLFSEVYKYNSKDPIAGDYLERNTKRNYLPPKIYSTEDHIVELTYSFTYKMSKEEEEYLSTEIPKILAKLSISKKSDSDKIKSIYNYVCSNIAYQDNEVTAYSALKNHYANCQGFSTLLYRMLLSSGIESRIISGKAKGVSHSWNIVKYQGYWYSLDATFDRYTESHGNYRYYIIPGSSYNNDAFPDHERDAQYKGSFYTSYPMKTKVVKILPSVKVTTRKKTTTIKYKNLKKKSQTISPLKIISPAPLNCSIIPSKYSKYFSISKTNGKITIKKISKKNKPKKRTYSLKIKITSSETGKYKASPAVYRTIKIKIK